MIFSPWPSGGGSAPTMTAHGRTWKLHLASQECRSVKTCGMCGINSCCWPPAPGVTADSLSTIHTHDLFTCHSQVPLISGHKAQVKDRFLPHQRIVKSACSGHFTSFERGTRCRLSTIHHPLALPFVQPIRVHPACCPLHSGCLASGPKTNGFTEPHHWPS